ncbi:hypothetical protein BDV12DRAFT_170436 [Aspergillus spectabilis]
MPLDHIEYLRDVGKYRAIGYPRTLPAERQHAITKNHDLLELEKRLKELQIQETASKAHVEVKSEGSNNENVDDDISFAVKLTKKQIQVLKVRRHNSSLLQYREEWVQTRVETQGRTGGRLLGTVVYNDVAHCMFKAQPDRQRIASLMPMDKQLSYQDMLSVVEGLLSYCTNDYDTFYRPGQEPVNGRCPVWGCDLNWRVTRNYKPMMR